jgi:hypothetical protein
MNWSDLLMAHGLSLGATIITGAVAWGKIHERIRTNHERISELESRCDHYDQFAERFAALSTDIKWIKEGLRESRTRGGDSHRGRDDRGDANDS